MLNEKTQQLVIATYISGVRGLSKSSEANCQGLSCPGTEETTEDVPPYTSFI